MCTPSTIRLVEVWLAPTGPFWSAGLLPKKGGQYAILGKTASLKLGDQ